MKSLILCCVACLMVSLFVAIPLSAEQEEWIPTPDAVDLVHEIEDSRSLIVVNIEPSTACDRVDSWGEVVGIGNEFSVDTRMFVWTGICIMVIPEPIFYTYDLGELPNGYYRFEFKAWGALVKSLSFAIGEPCTVSIEAEEMVDKGDTFPVAVNIGDTVDLAGFQLDISFDPAILEAVEVAEGTFLSAKGETYCLDPNMDNATGIITGIACAKTSKGGVDGSGTLATVKFKAIGVGESYIRLQNVTLSDSNGSIIPVTSLDGSVTVTEFPPWDVNRDGRVDIIDLVLVGQHFGEHITVPIEPNPDVNGDGIVNIIDVVLVGQHFGETYFVAQ